MIENGGLGLIGERSGILCMTGNRVLGLIGEGKWGIMYDTKRIIRLDRCEKGGYCK